jgi:hypothetical protein
VSGIGQKTKDMVRELKDTLVVMHIWNMAEYNAPAAEHIFVESEKVNDEWFLK